MKPWRLFWVLALAAAGPLEGQATGQITGTVRNKEGQPTASASVMVRGTRIRSEEHTSELQSPHTISYAVFCLKKKKKKN